MLVEFLAKRRKAAMRLGDILCGIRRCFGLGGRGVIFGGHDFILTPPTSDWKGRSRKPSVSIPIHALLTPRGRLSQQHDSALSFIVGASLA